MLRKSSEAQPQTRDSFFDDGDEETSTSHPPPVISSIRIVTSKPPIYRQQSQSSSSPSPSSDCSDHDVTDVSSLGGDHQRVQQQQEEHENHSRKQARDQHHPFHLHSMRHVLLGSSAPTSRPPSPADTQERLHKKHVRIVTDESDKSLSQNRHHHHQQPYIHGHTKDFRRVRLTSSAINRQKQQQKIERENLRILERLQHTRATRGLKRDELLTHYDRQMGFVTYPTPPSSMPASRFHLPSRPASATMMSATFSTSEKKSKNPSRPSSASHAMNNSQTRSRPVSAPTSLNGSSRSTSSARKTTWNDRWQQHE